MLSKIKRIRVELEIKNILLTSLFYKTNKYGRSYYCTKCGTIILYLGFPSLFTIYYNLLISILGVDITKKFKKEEIIIIVNKLYNPNNLENRVYD